MADLLTPAVLRRDLAEIIAAAFMGSLALAALGLYLLRRRSADAASLTFAAFYVPLCDQAVRVDDVGARSLVDPRAAGTISGPL